MPINTRVKKKVAKKSRVAARRTNVARTRRSADDLLSRIVLSAAVEFRRCGYAGTTTASIARKADVTEAQLFRYFGSKSNLFRETIFKPLDQQLLRFVSHYKPDLDDNAKRRESAARYASALQHFIRENAGTLTSLFVAQIYDPGTVHGVGKINSLTDYFDHGASMMKSHIQGKAKVDPRLMVRLSFIAVLGTVMFKDWIFPDGIASDDELEAALTDFVLEGIGANNSR